MIDNSSARETLTSKLGVVLVAAGSSVGLGNIWRFPYIAGEGGGGAFMLIYLAAVILIGKPIMLSEFVVGRNTHRSAVGAYRKLDKRWQVLGYNGVIVAFLIMGFYYVVAGWTAEYFVASVSGELGALSTPKEYGDMFNNFVTSSWKPVIYTFIFVGMTHLVIVRGVTKGIEKVSKVLMPILLVILVILSINSVMMPGAMEGLIYLFKPDFSKVTPQVVMQAVGQAFFSLSVGIGCLIAYSSYFSDDNDMRKTSMQVTMLDTSVAILSAVMIFPAVFSAGIEPSQGPSLVFITLPTIFQSMPMPMLWSSIFFLLLIIAALTSTISLHEVVTLHLHEEHNMSRKKATYLTTIGVSILGVFASLSLGVLSSFTIFGLNIFDFLDTLTADVLMPLGGLFTCLFVGWRMDRGLFYGELMQKGEDRSYVVDSAFFLLRYVCPVILIIIMLDAFKVF
ncbi:MAG: sodium-dependent transporter [Rikenellaceae bacterium]